MGCRRHRHLNRAHCGALLDFDSRFITGQADGSQPASWANRGSSSFDLTRTGTASHLLYETNQQAGQPRMRFSNTGAQLQTVSINAASNGYTDGHTMVAVCRSAKANSTQRLFYAWGTTANSNLMQLWAQFSDNLMYLDHRNDTTGRASAAVATTSDVTLLSAMVTSSNGNVRRNGAQVVNGARSGSLASASNIFYLGGSSSGQRFTGDYYAFIHAPLASESLRRRMEQSVAFSFKVAI